MALSNKVGARFVARNGIGKLIDAGSIPIVCTSVLDVKFGIRGSVYLDNGKNSQLSFFMLEGNILSILNVLNSLLVIIIVKI